VLTSSIGRETYRFQLSVRRSPRRFPEICQHSVGTDDALFLIPMCWGENRSFAALAYPFSTLRLFFGRMFRKRKLPRTSLLSAPVTLTMLGSSLALARGLDDHEKGWPFDED
jgi:hypothetical protein